MQAVVRGARGYHHNGLVGPVLDRHVAVRQRPRDLEQEPAGDDSGAFAIDGSLDRCAQRQLHVRRRKVEVTPLRAQLNASEYEHGSTRRDTSSDDREPRRELVTWERNPQSGAHYDF